MPNMCSSTVDSSEHQNRYLEEHNLVECFFETLPSMNREIKHSIIFQMVFTNVYYSLFFFLIFMWKVFFLTLLLAKQLVLIPFCEKGNLLIQLKFSKNFYNRCFSCSCSINTLSDDNLYSLTYLQHDVVITIPKTPNEEVFLFLSNALVETCTRSSWSILCPCYVFLDCELTEKWILTVYW